MPTSSAMRCLYFSNCLSGFKNKPLNVNNVFRLCESKVIASSLPFKFSANTPILGPKSD